MKKKFESEDSSAYQINPSTSNTSVEVKGSTYLCRSEIQHVLDANVTKKNPNCNNQEGQIPYRHQTLTAIMACVTGQTRSSAYARLPCMPR